jgi:hypothetical protein
MRFGSNILALPLSVQIRSHYRCAIKRRAADSLPASAAVSLHLR